MWHKPKQISEPIWVRKNHSGTEMRLLVISLHQEALKGRGSQNEIVLNLHLILLIQILLHHNPMRTRSHGIIVWNMLCSPCWFMLMEIGSLLLSTDLAFPEKQINRWCFVGFICPPQFSRLERNAGALAPKPPPSFLADLAPSKGR